MMSICRCGLWRTVSLQDVLHFLIVEQWIFRGIKRLWMPDWDVWLSSNICSLWYCGMLFRPNVWLPETVWRTNTCVLVLQKAPCCEISFVLESSAIIINVEGFITSITLLQGSHGSPAGRLWCVFRAEAAVLPYVLLQGIMGRLRIRWNGAKALM